MAKRFTSTEKWEDVWFRRLPIKQKCIWQYLCDRCDNAGVWSIDYDMMSFYIGDRCDQSDIDRLNIGKERIRYFNSDYIVIFDFIPYQIGNIYSRDLTNLQKSCNLLLNKYVTI